MNDTTRTPSPRAASRRTRGSRPGGAPGQVAPPQVVSRRTRRSARGSRGGVALGAAALALLLLAPLSSRALEPDMHPGELAHALDRLASTARVLYVAAHPDDENTRLLAWLANRRHVRAAYLSMTRGGGGQNLIGTEQGELLDAIRTEELLAARRLDGAEQRFTLARDFGYSKSADEALRVWGEEAALGDVVRVIRTFQPDVIVTRFDEIPPNHGHHIASAILAREAFAAAADPARFPEQGLAPWRSVRLLHNFTPWRGQPPEGALAVDVGGFDPRLGLGYAELAALSRSQHKSQGFGVAGERGRLIEYFVPVAGSAPKEDLLEGVPSTWAARFGEAGAAVDRAFDAARGALDRDRPEGALPHLLRAREALASLPPSQRKADAAAGIDEMIAAAAGIFVRATAAAPAAVPGGEVEVELEIVPRLSVNAEVTSIRFPGEIAQAGAGRSKGEHFWREAPTERVVPAVGAAAPAQAPEAGPRLEPEPEASKRNKSPARAARVNQSPPLRAEQLIHSLGEKRLFHRKVRIPADAKISAPHWLDRAPAPGRFEASDAAIAAHPRGPAALYVDVELKIDRQPLRLRTPVVHAWTDRVQGERVRPFLIVPPATVTPTREAVLLPNGAAGSVALRIRAGKSDLRGKVRLQLPEGWRSEPASRDVVLAKAGDETTVRFDVRAPKGAAPIRIHPEVEVDGVAWAMREDVIDYPHIPVQTVLQPASLRLAPLALQIPSGRIGYVQGSGDSIPEDLAHVGVHVEAIDDDTLRTGDLDSFAAIVVGIRAYNTRQAVVANHERLMKYVERGGVVVVQYVTVSRWSPLEAAIGPFPLEIGPGRVTDETAAMTAVDPREPLLRAPNEIGAADFEGWVQERGLYFASTWDPRYRPLFRAADPGEEAQEGSTLVARHGKGRYVYTGLAFFRQLRAGVPGAYRLFCNLVSPP